MSGTSHGSKNIVHWLGVLISSEGESSLNLGLYGQQIYAYRGPEILEIPLLITFKQPSGYNAIV